MWSARQRVLQAHCGEENQLPLHGDMGSTPNPVNGRLLQLDTMAELAKD
jgi:hypothetical protein